MSRESRRARRARRRAERRRRKGKGHKVKHHYLVVDDPYYEQIHIRSSTKGDPGFTIYVRKNRKRVTKLD